MDNKSFYGRPKNVALQERALAEAQRKLDRAEKIRAEMIKQVELEMQRLNEMKEVQEDFTQSGGTEPSLTNVSPSTFQSQFEQFNTTRSNERLKLPGNDSASPMDYIGKLLTPKDDEPSYSTSDRDEHWQHLTEDPGKKVYVSGYYYSSGANTKRYEYELGSTQLPISVGDMVSAPVHNHGHNDGKFLRGHDRRFVVTDIYTKEKFHPYHDTIW